MMISPNKSTEELPTWLRESLLQDPELSNLLLELKRRQIKSSFRLWCEIALASAGQTPAAHHLLLIDHLERVSRGEIDRLMILMPPGSAKSTYASVLFPPWWFLNHPHSAVIAASHTTLFARKWGRRVRNLIAEHQPVLGYGLAEDDQAADHWTTSVFGEYGAFGIGAAVTGRRADLLLIDDPVAGHEAAASEVQRDATWEWYRQDAYTRLRPNGRIVLIMTRWHELDLGGQVLNAQETTGEQWHVLKLPAIAEFDDPLGREFGEPLWPDWQNAEALARVKNTIGPQAWGSLYQQNPQPLEGTLFSLDHLLVEGQPVECPPLCDAVFATIDTAVKTGSSNDGTAVVYCATSSIPGFHPLIILDWSIDQIEGSLLEAWLPNVFQRLEELARQCRARMGSMGAWIEDKGSGTILLQQAGRRGLMARPIESRLTTMGKEERALSVSGYVHRGDVKIAQMADKITIYKGVSKNHLLSQVVGFRLGTKDRAADDLLDCFSYAVAISLGNPEGF